MNITITTPIVAENDSVNNLLWKVLWEPVGLPQNIREEFKLSGEEITLIAKDANRLYGVIVANKVDETEYEIRHLAVDPDFQKRGVGKMLLSELIKALKEKSVKTVRTIARDTSQSFFEMIGFEKIDNYPDHPHFLKHGIRFVLMKKMI